MQGKALAALAILLAAVALGACGGGGDEETTGAAETTEQAQRPDAPKELRQRAGQVEKERRQGGTNGAGQKQDGEDASPAPAPAPPTEHSDSGGGAAQFHRKGSDNSIQEFGAEGGGSERAGAAAVLHAYFDARAAGRWEDACSHLSSSVIAALEQFAAANGGEGRPQDCPDLLQALTSGAGPAGLRATAKADVGSLRLQGDRGFLLYHGPQATDFSMPVVLEAGEWKLDAPEGTPLP